MVTYSVPQVLIQGPLLSMLYNNNLTLGVNSYSKPLMFVDKLSVLITANSLQMGSAPVLNHMSK